MDSKPTVAIIGCGYVGLTTAAILANCGYKVRALEINPDRLKVIKTGRSFFYEAGIDQLLQAAFESGSLVATDSYEEAIPGSSVVFSCVGTPDNPDGSSNLNYVFDAAAKAAELLEAGAVFVQKSTVPVGTGQKVEQTFTKLNKNISYVSNPEFLREGTAISDTLWFDRIVVGSDDKPAAEKIAGIYGDVEQNRDKIAKVAGLSPPASMPKTEYIITSLSSAELIKVTANAFLALKISFANSIAKLADHAGANIEEVMNAVGADRRIGRAFLNAGRGYGGGCFPKDVSGLIRSAEDYGVNMEIMHAATEVNDSMPHYIINRAKPLVGGSYKGAKVSVLGLSFKPGTSDTRRSPAVAIANTLAEQGAEVRAYDPAAATEAKEMLDQNVNIAGNLDEALSSDYIFIATDWPELKTLPANKLDSTKLVVDCMNCLNDEAKARLAGRYIGVGVTQ